MDFLEALQKSIGAHSVKAGKSENPKYLKDESYLTGPKPLAIAFPKNTNDIEKILRICNKYKIKVVVRGGGSSLTGSSIPTSRSIVVDMSGFSKILETHVEDEYVIVEPGVTLDMLNHHLSKLNYFYPPDPASSAFATIGGTISTNAGGLRALTYGTTKEWVLGLEVVLPNGQTIWTGSRTTKRSIGYDLTALIVGSEGTLCVVTKAILKIWPKPEAVGRIMSYYTTMEDAAVALGELKKRGTIPLSSEFMDRPSMQLMHEYMEISFPKDAKYAMLVDIAGNREAIPRLLQSSEKILSKNGAISIKLSTSRPEMEKMYNARKYLFNATVKKAEKQNKSVIIADIVVPSSELSETLYEMEKEIKKQELEVILFGHIGDGNIHGNIIADMHRQSKKIEKLQTTFGNIALRHKGSVSGEHGIGLTKKELLIKEMKSRKSEYSIELMREIKKVFDPKGILNKGKIFD